MVLEDWPDSSRGDLEGERPDDRYSRDPGLGTKTPVTVTTGKREQAGSWRVVPFWL